MTGELHIYGCLDAVAEELTYYHSCKQQPEERSEDFRVERGLLTPLQCLNRNKLPDPVGGVPGGGLGRRSGTLTEDYALGMLLKMNKWHCRYVEEYWRLETRPTTCARASSSARGGARCTPARGSFHAVKRPLMCGLLEVPGQHVLHGRLIMRAPAALKDRQPLPLCISSEACQLRRGAMWETAFLLA